MATLGQLCPSYINKAGPDRSVVCPTAASVHSLFLQRWAVCALASLSVVQVLAVVKDLVCGPGPHHGLLHACKNEAFGYMLGDMLEGIREETLNLQVLV